MLSKLSIRNYAIIKDLAVDFSPGFCVITGETGAGKSIIMGALALILGQRADTSILNDNQKKCIIEGRFSIEPNSQIETFFSLNDLDFDSPVILRREINASGKSRAFINDTPVQLNLLRELGIQIIDIHSQHSNLELGKRTFQLNVLDWFGNHAELVKKYGIQFNQFAESKKQLAATIEKAEKAKADFDYFQFQFKQLDEVNLKAGEQAELEQEQEMLNHSEEIKTGLSQLFAILDGDELAVLPRLKESVLILSKLKHFLPQAEELHQRLESSFVELQDVASEAEQLGETSEHDPEKLNLISERLDLIYSLQQKHRVDTIEQLIAIRDDFDAKIQMVTSFEHEIEVLTKTVDVNKEKAMQLALSLSEKRKQVAIKVEKEITRYLQQLGMPHASLKISVESKSELVLTGIDEVNFLFSANKGGVPEEINKVASGGELSRLMLAIKAVVSKSKALPAIIFDEIDTGISGEVAMKMAVILKQMSANMQVINITHLPQIASKGNTHYKVFKTETAEIAETGMRLLNQNERVEEIAKMLSGENPTPQAIENAKVLLA